MNPSSRTLVPILALAFAATGFAQEKTGPDQTKTARKAYAEYQSLVEKLQAASKDYRKNPKDATLRAKYTKLAKTMRPGISAKRKAFEAAFRDADWNSLAKDEKLLRDGLQSICFDAGNDKALAACRAYLEHFGDSPLASRVRTMAMTNALLAAGQQKEAVANLEQALAKATAKDKASILMTLGDVLAAQGQTEQARKDYAEAAKTADTNTRRYLDLRIALVGEKAPEIDSSTWIGGDAKPLSKLTGKVVVVDFWATWCGPCRHVMPSLSKLYDEHHDDGLQVVGVTREYPYGYLPANPEQMTTGGESVKDMDSAAFLAHVTAFKNNAAISYPFVIGTKEDFSNYKISGIPTLAILDREGKVAMVVVGSGSEPLVKICVERLLGNA